MKYDRTVTFVLLRKHPEDFTLDRLAKYLRVLNDLAGPTGRVRLKKMTPGSVTMKLATTSDYYPEFATRVSSSGRAEAGPSIRKPREDLQAMVVEDNVDARIVAPGGQSLLFLKGYRTKPTVQSGPIRQEHTVRGRVIGLEGKDETKHVRIAVYATPDEARAEVKDGQLALRLKDWLFTDVVVELSGPATFRRNGDGLWEATAFRAERAEPLSNESAADVLSMLKDSLDRANVSTNELLEAKKLRG
jgi:hypothetical protein